MQSFRIKFILFMTERSILKLVALEIIFARLLPRAQGAQTLHNHRALNEKRDTFSPLDEMRVNG